MSMYYVFLNIGLGEHDFLMRENTAVDRSSASQTLQGKHYCPTKFSIKIVVIAGSWIMSSKHDISIIYDI